MIVLFCALVVVDSVGGTDIIRVWSPVKLPRFLHCPLEPYCPKDFSFALILSLLKRGAVFASEVVVRAACTLTTSSMLLFEELLLLLGLEVCSAF